MASPKKISELTTAGALTGAELVPIVQNAGTLQTTTAALKVFSLGTIENEVSVLNGRMAATSALSTQNAEAIVSINAVVSTKVNRVGDYMDTVQYIEFDTSTVVPASVGRLSWNIDEGTLDIGFDNQGVILHVGLQLYERVYNDTAATLPKGAIVRITGSQGQRLTAAPALANNDTNSATTFAFMAEAVSVNRAGYAVTEGILKNINTGGIPDGAVLWLSPVSAGVYTPTKPVAPQHLVPVGFVVKGNSVGAGSVYVKIINGLELGELHDAKVSAAVSLTNGELFAYNTSAGVWTNNSQLRVDNSNVVVGEAAVSTDASVGFLWVPSCAGIPTGTPASYPGRSPIVIDTTNHRFYFYSGGAWRNAGP